ncbi:hypothetical protein Prum_043740 [Phytohabitans rumicis]|uniref:Uncharacterized protein n=1 Tax=Phytohabitans rumicis TaxID=1076125 RepID=A0A6V8L067_9ACTN|nr:hypothetical protein Prum_043740 [Phytohabitans rumicis]
MPVGPLRVVRVPVDGDPDQVAGDRFGAGVVEGPPDDTPVAAFPVRQGGDLLLHDQAGAGGQPLLWYGWVAVAGRHGPRVPQLVVLLVALPDRTAGAEDRLRATGEVLGRTVPPSFDVAHVRRVKTHAGRELLLAHAPLDPPPGKLGRERVRSPLYGRCRHLFGTSGRDFQSAFPPARPNVNWRLTDNYLDRSPPSLLNRFSQLRNVRTHHV